MWKQLQFSNKLILIYVHSVGINLVLLFIMQPHGFFNCSPAVDVPPSAGDLDDKENGMPAKPIQNELIAKL
jgi:hypothetical protein